MPWRDGRLTSNLHWDGYGKDHKSAGTKFSRPGVMNGWHTFGLLWLPEEYVFYVDGQETWRTSAGGVSQVPEFVKLTEEIGNWGGEIQKAKLPDYFVVDYVRVYEAEAKQSNDETRRAIPCPRISFQQEALRDGTCATRRRRGWPAAPGLRKVGSLKTRLPPESPVLLRIVCPGRGLHQPRDSVRLPN